MDLCALSVSEMRSKLDSKQISAQELAQAHLERAGQLDSKIRAFISITAERAMHDAVVAQAMIDDGRASALTGIPVALKDNIATKSANTTCASKILESYVPPYESTVSQKLSEVGAVLIGKTNLDEFAMGTSTEFSGFFPTHNPWNLDYVPGGSSGGSAAAVAAGFAPLAFGSDTGGSVRQPASLCGIVGLKPTYGRVSRYGLIAFASSLDQIGPLSRNVTDAIHGFEAVFGKDARDSTTVDVDYDPAAAREIRLRGRKIGIPEEMFSDAIDSDVRELVSSAISRLADDGVEFEEFSAPMIEHGVSTYYIIAPAEASSNLARYDGVRFGLRVPGKTHIELMEATRAAGFGKEVRERIIIGTYVLSSGYYDAYYAKAHQVRTLMRRELKTAFEKFDAIICPTSPGTAFKIGERTEDPLALKLADYCTIPANMSGCPAISLNCGFSNGLPVGLQLIADSYCESKLFSLALSAEAALGFEDSLAPC